MSSHIDRALVLIDTRPDLAAREIKNALSQDPENARAHGLLACCLVDTGEVSDALREAHEAIRLAPIEPLGYYVLARCHFDLDKLIEAEVAIEEALQLDPLNPAYWGLLANIEIRNGELQKALEAVDSGLHADPEDTFCHNVRAYILTQMGKANEADASMQTAISADPENAITHAYHGWVEVARHHPEKSLDHFRQALRRDPSMEWARLGLIKALQIRHPFFQLHLKLKSKLSGLVIALWFFANIYCIEVSRTMTGSKDLLMCGLTFSWIGLVALSFIVFLPATLIGEPILKFLLQFESDGRLALTDKERRQNIHLVFFICVAAVSIIVGFLAQTWLPLNIAIMIYIVSLPFNLPPEERTMRMWLTCGAIAAIVCAVVFYITTPWVAVYAGRWFVAASIWKMTASAKLVKIIAGVFGVSMLANNWRAKKKAEVRKKLFGPE